MPGKTPCLKLVTQIRSQEKVCLGRMSKLVTQIRSQEKVGLLTYFTFHIPLQFHKMTISERRQMAIRETSSQTNRYVRTISGHPKLRSRLPVKSLSTHFLNQFSTNLCNDVDIWVTGSILLHSMYSFNPDKEHQDKLSKQINLQELKANKNLFQKIIFFRVSWLVLTCHQV